MQVLVVEDDDFTRMLLGSTLRELGHDVVAESATVADGLESARLNRPDAAVIDLDFGRGPSGIDLAHGLRRLLPRIGIVMLTGYVEPRLLGHTRPLPSAAVYLVKRSVRDQSVLDAALTIAIDPAAARHVEALPVAASLGRRRRLSDGQVEIMRLVAEGCSNAEIAHRRHLSEPAVVKAIARLCQQLDIRTGPGANQRVLVAQSYFRLAGTPPSEASPHAEH